MDTASTPQQDQLHAMLHSPGAFHAALKAFYILSRRIQSTYRGYELRKRGRRFLGLGIVALTSENAPTVASTRSSWSHCRSRGDRRSAAVAYLEDAVRYAGPWSAVGRRARAVLTAAREAARTALAEQRRARRAVARDATADVHLCFRLALGFLGVFDYDTSSARTVCLGWDEYIASNDHVRNAALATRESVASSDIYVIGGESVSSSRVLQSLEVWTLGPRLRWTRRATQALSRDFVGCSAAADAEAGGIFLVGGVDNDGGNGLPIPAALRPHRTLARTVFYDARRNRWTACPSQPEPTWRSACACVYHPARVPLGAATKPGGPLSSSPGGSMSSRWPEERRRRLYAIGGESRGQAQAHVQIYDVTEETWRFGAPLPYAVADAGVGVCSFKIYVVGGWVNEGSEENRSLGISAKAAGRTDKMQIYDALSDSWSIGTPLPVPIDSPCTAVSNGSLYLFGGVADPDDHGCEPLLSAWVYSPEHAGGGGDGGPAQQAEEEKMGSWRALPPMPETRPGAVASPIPGSNLICILGGGWSGACDLCFDTETEKWVSLRAEKVGSSSPSSVSPASPASSQQQQQQQQQQQRTVADSRVLGADLRRRCHRERDRGAVGRRGHVALAL